MQGAIAISPSLMMVFLNVLSMLWSTSSNMVWHWLWRHPWPKAAPWPKAVHPSWPEAVGVARRTLNLHVKGTRAIIIVNVQQTAALDVEPPIHAKLSVRRRVVLQDAVNVAIVVAISRL